MIKLIKARKCTEPIGATVIILWTIGVSLCFGSVIITSSKASSLIPDIRKIEHIDPGGDVFTASEGSSNNSEEYPKMEINNLLSGGGLFDDSNANVSSKIKDDTQFYSDDVGPDPLAFVCPHATKSPSIMRVTKHNSFPVAAISKKVIVVGWASGTQHRSRKDPYISFTCDYGKKWTEPIKLNFPENGDNVALGGLTVPMKGPLKGMIVVSVDGSKEGSKYISGKGEEIDKKNAANNKASLIAMDLKSKIFSEVGKKWTNYVVFDGITAARPTQISDTDFVLTGYGGNGMTSDRIGWSNNSKKFEHKYWSKSGVNVGSEPNIVVWKDKSSGNKTLMMMVRDDNIEKRSIGQTYSYDEGRTWKDHRSNIFPGTGAPHTLVLKDGRIITTYRGAITGSGNTNPSAMLRISSDGGKTWSDEQEFGRGRHNSEYADLVEYKPGKILIAWGKADADPPSNVAITRIELNPKKGGVNNIAPIIDIKSGE